MVNAPRLRDRPVCMPDTDFTALTEQWGMPMPAVQVAMARARYDLGRSVTSGRAVLEIGCGTGFGLDYLADTARFVVGGDLSTANLAQVRAHVPLAMVTCLDAHHLPFRAGAFDAVVVFEAIYYFADATAVLDECRRLLAPDGVLVLSMPNPAHRGFHASPHSVRYFTASQLFDALGDGAWTTELWCGFPDEQSGWRSRALARVTGLANRLGLIPRDLRGRARLKRLVYGPLPPFAGLRHTSGPSQQLVPVTRTAPTEGFRMLYATARRA